MPSNNDFQPVTVSVTVGDAVVSTQGFGTPAILADEGEGTGLSEVVNTYTIGDDITADYADTTGAYREFQAMNQTLHSPSAKIIARPADIQQQQTITFPDDFISGDVITVDIDVGAATAEVTYATSHAATMAALLVAIAALTDYVSAATNVARVVTVTTAKTLAVTYTGNIAITATVDHTAGADTPGVVAETVAAYTAGDALTDSLDSDGDWFGLVSAARDDVDDYRIGKWANANAPTIFISQSNTAAIVTSATTDVASKLKDQTNNVTACSYHGLSTEALAASWLAFNLATDLDTTTGNWAYSALTGLTPDTLTGTQKTQARAKNVNVFIKVSGDGRPIFGTMAGGRYIDIQVTAFWFQARMNEALTALIKNKGNAGGKLPNTDAGRAEVKAVMETICKTAETAGHAIEGSSVVVVPALSAQSAGDKAARQLSGVSARFTASGGINEIVCAVTITI